MPQEHPHRRHVRLARAMGISRTEFYARRAQKARALRATGASLREIGVVLGITAASVHRLLHPRCRRKRLNNGQFVAEYRKARDRTIVERRRQGRSYQQLGDEFGLTIQRIWGILKREGLTGKRETQ